MLEGIVITVLFIATFGMIVCNALKIEDYDALRQGLEQHYKKEIYNIKFNNRRKFETLLEGLPNFYKDDIELVIKVDYPNRQKEAILVDNRGFHVKLSLKERRTSSYEVRLDNIISRAKEIRRIEEQCCPNKPKATK